MTSFTESLAGRTFDAVTAECRQLRENVALADLSVPSHIISTADDPMIPVSDLERLARGPALTPGQRPAYLRATSAPSFPSGLGFGQVKNWLRGSHLQPTTPKRPVTSSIDWKLRI